MEILFIHSPTESQQIAWHLLNSSVHVWTLTQFYNEYDLKVQALAQRLKSDWVVDLKAV